LISVLQIINSNTIGGINTVVKQLDEALSNKADIEFSTCVYSNDNSGFVNFESINNFIRINNNGIINLLFHLRRCLKKYDIVLLHGFTPLVSFGIIGLKLKIVFINHGIIGTGRKLILHEYLKILLFQIYILLFVDKIVSVSQFSMDKLLDSFVFPRKKCSIIYNSVNLPAVRYSRRSNGKVILGFHGRFVKFKRIERLLNTANFLKTYFEIKIILLGTGPLLNEYLNIGNKLDLDITIIPYNNNIKETISQFDFEVIPSDEENFGISVIESIMLGIITFVFKDGGGCTEIYSRWFFLVYLR
jgi:glycosyltransferase involved in cell wall biosynthesis